MPVVPSFTGYAPAPNLAEAYLGGQRINVAREQIAQQAQEASARLAQQRVAAEMEMAARREVQAQEALRRQQELEIEKSYRQTQIGLEERRIQQAQQKLEMDLRESARSFAAQQQFQQEMAAPGADPMKVLMRLGPSVGASIPSAAFSAQEAPVPFGKEYPVAGGGRVVQTSERGGQFVPAELPSSGVARTEPVVTPDGRVLGHTVTLPSGRQQFVREQADPRIKDFKSEVEKLEKEIGDWKIRNSDNLERLDTSSKAYKKLEAHTKQEVDDILKKQNRIAELQGLIRGLENRQSSTPAAVPPGMGTSTTNRIGRFNVIQR